LETSNPLCRKTSLRLTVRAGPNPVPVVAENHRHGVGEAGRKPADNFIHKPVKMPNRVLERIGVRDRSDHFDRKTARAGAEQCPASQKTKRRGPILAPERFLKPNSASACTLFHNPRKRPPDCASPDARRGRPGPATDIFERGLGISPDLSFDDPIGRAKNRRLG